MIKFLDCTLRDGGYYNDWDFKPELITSYLSAMAALNVEFIELGFRSLNNQGFKGGCAFTTDNFIQSLSIPSELNDKIGVMINGSELLTHSAGLLKPEVEANLKNTLKKLFSAKSDSPVTLVRIACHVHEFESCLPASTWLKDQGYLVGFNLMQVADRNPAEITQLATMANQYPIDVLYFADSMGSLNTEQTNQIISAFQAGWQGELGIHTHDNMGQAIANCNQAISDGVTWLDSTVTGMGRGPGNAQTEFLILAIEEHRKVKSNPTKLFELIRKHFKPMQNLYGWGTNPYYYLAGKYGIHPSYIQEMLSDNRYNEEDILAVINHLKIEGGKKFSVNTLESARHFYAGEAVGTWAPADDICGKSVLIIGTGPGVQNHKPAVESFIKKQQPFVIALNTQKSIAEELINIRAACHPVRLLADCQEHLTLPQPLVTPASMLPEDVKKELGGKTLLDFGLCVKANKFEFSEKSCILPTSLVMVYALAIANSGQARTIYLAGFDGYPEGDPRNDETNELFEFYQNQPNSIDLHFITPTRYRGNRLSIYGHIN